MNFDEAKAWLRGERSNANYIRGHGDNIAQQESFLAVADAASTQQAYYVVKANREGLLNAKPRYWAVVNDLIGGWDVSEFNKPVSEHGQDEWTLGSFMSAETAKMVANALNNQ